MRKAATACVIAFGMVFLPVARGYADQHETVEDEPPAESAAPAAPEEPCPKGKRGGAVGGIVVGSVFWWVLPMSIPVLITQSKKLKAHNKAKLERRCQYAPRN